MAKANFLSIVVACFLICSPAAAQTAEFPLTLAASAQVTNGTTTITTTLTIHVDRLTIEMNRTRLTDAFKYGGYPGFLPALRNLPLVGTIEVEKRKVDVRYAHEQRDAKGRRLILVGDRPLFFLGAPTKPRAGYELTVVDLALDDQGAGTGTIAGAARVKLGPDGGVILDDFDEAPVQLTIRRVPEK